MARRNDPTPAPETSSAKAHKAVRGGVVGFLIDQYDIFLPVFVLAPAAIYFYGPPGTDGAASVSVIAALIFVSTLVGRPVGALVFGFVADRTGRRRATLIATFGFATLTTLMAAVPGYASIGAWSWGVLIMLRFLNGIFLAGGYTAAIPLAMEWSPKERRGHTAGLIGAAAQIGYFAVSAITLIMLWIAPAGGLDSAYVQWGWRVPFLIGGLASFAFGVNYMLTVSESKVWSAETEHVPVRQRSPLGELFRGEHRRSVGQVFVMMTGSWVLLYLAATYLPTALTAAGVNTTQVTATFLIASLFAMVGNYSAGVVSQRVGRRRFYIGYGVAAAVLGSVAYGFALQFMHGGVLLLGIFVTLTQLCAYCAYGVHPAYLNERFPAHMRATGYAVAYSLSLVVPSMYAFYIVWLGSVVPSGWAPPVLMVVGGALLAIGAAIGPETKDVDMSETTSDDGQEGRGALSAGAR